MFKSESIINVGHTQRIEKPLQFQLTQKSYVHLSLTPHIYACTSALTHPSISLFCTAICALPPTHPDGLASPVAKSTPNWSTQDLGKPRCIGCHHGTGGAPTRDIKLGSLEACSGTRVSLPPLKTLTTCGWCGQKHWRERRQEGEESFCNFLLLCG
jgi:hypothetical protein